MRVLTFCVHAHRIGKVGRNKMATVTIAAETTINIPTISWNIHRKAVRIESISENKVPLSAWIVIINFWKEIAVRILPYRISFQLAICKPGLKCGQYWQ